MYRFIGADLAVVEDDDAVTHLAYFLHNMGREDDRTFLTERTNKGTDLDELVRIETCGRFIEDEQLGVAKQGLGETDTLTIAFAEFTDVLMPLRRQADTVDELVDRCAVRPLCCKTGFACKTACAVRLFCIICSRWGTKYDDGSWR